MNIGDELRRKLDGAVNWSRTGWDFKKKMKIFINPEANCPYCSTEEEPVWFPTNRVWLVNDGTNYLRGCWNLDGSPIGPGKIIHPHAWMSGEVCLGKAQTASEALFTGVDKGKHIHYVPRWLVELGHDCGHLPWRKCPICESKFFDDKAVIFGYKNVFLCSQECRTTAIFFRCEHCLCLLDLKEGIFCDECDEKLHIPCSICSERMLIHRSYYYSREDLRCCTECFNTRLRTCRECGYQEKLDDLDDDGHCINCISDGPIFRCIDCGTRVTGEGDITDRRCQSCHEYCGDCEGSPCECEPDEGFEPFEEEEEQEEFEETHALDYLPINQPILVNPATEEEPNETLI